MRRVLLALAAMLLFAAVAHAETAVRYSVPEELTPFAFALGGADGGTIRVIKTDMKRPEFLFAQYLRVGEIYRAPFQPADGRLAFGFAFWDPGSYEVRVEVPGRPDQVEKVEVNWPAGQYARTAVILGLLLAAGVLVGYVSYTLPRPAARAAALLMLLAFTGAAGTAGATGAHEGMKVEGQPRAYDAATLTFDLPARAHDVKLLFRHQVDDLDLVRSEFRANGPVLFSYLFPEGAPYEARLVATPVGGGSQLELHHLLKVEPVHPTDWERWRGWLVGMGFFVVGGAIGLWLGRRATPWGEALSV